MPPISPPDVVETERLRLEPWCAEHTALLVRLSSLPEVTRYIATGEVWPRERAVEWSERAVAHWASHGFGWRAAFDRATCEPVGFIALNFLGQGMPGLSPEEYEIGWWLDPAAQGRGLASEGARAVRDDAFAVVGAPSVIARLQPGNVGSRRVAEGIGLALEGELTGIYGEDVLIYRGRP